MLLLVNVFQPLDAFQHKQALDKAKISRMQITIPYPVFLSIAS